MFVGLFFSFSEDLSFKLVVYSPTRLLGDPKPRVTVYNTTLDQNRKGLTNCVLGGLLSDSVRTQACVQMQYI